MKLPLLEPQQGINRVRLRSASIPQNASMESCILRPFRDPASVLPLRAAINFAYHDDTKPLIVWGNIPENMPLEILGSATSSSLFPADSSAVLR